MRCLAVALLIALAACANANPEKDPISVAPAALTLAVGVSGTVTVTGPDDLSGIAWSTDDPGVASVTGAPDGSATIMAVGTGHTTISALLGVVAASVDVTVTPATVDRIDVTAVATIVPLGTTSQLTARAHYTDQHFVDVTQTATWAAADPTLATIDLSGLLTSVAVGTTDISATVGTTTGKLSVMTSAAALTALAINDAAPGAVPKGIDHPLTARGTFTDGTTTDVTAQVAWSSSNTASATVAAGIVHAVDVGTSTITASEGAITTTHMVTISSAVIAKLALTGGDFALALGRDQTVMALGTYSDGSTNDITSVATWTATGTAATVTTGLVHAAMQGQSSITASLGGAMDTVVASVGPAVPDHLSLPSGNVTLAASQRVHLRAFVIYSDLTSVEVTNTATWSSSNSALPVAAGTITSGTTAVTTTITAMSTGFTGTLTATTTTNPCHVVVNEVQAGGVSGADEWVELYNPCLAAVDVSNWTIDYRAFNNTTAIDNNQLALLTGTMVPDSYRLYTGTGFTGTATVDGSWGGGATGLLQATAGGIGLRSGPKDTGTLVDAIAYGTVTAGFIFAEGTSGTALVNGKSIARLVDGLDTNNNALDTTLATPTPRAPD